MLQSGVTSLLTQIYSERKPLWSGQYCYLGKGDASPIAALWKYANDKKHAFRKALNRRIGEAHYEAADETKHSLKVPNLYFRKWG
jgi:hypothetical protein